MDKIYSIESPDGKIEVQFGVDETSGSPYFSLSVSDQEILIKSPLGIKMRSQDLNQELTLVSASESKVLLENYELIHGKNSLVKSIFNERVFTLENKSGLKFKIIFRLSNEGIGFRYDFPEQKANEQIIEKEFTAYVFPEGSKMWIQPIAAPKTGWNKTNPSYEEDYFMGVSLDMISPTQSGWVYPALFQVGDHWALISETALGSDFCGSRLKSLGNNSLGVVYPSEQEAFTGREFLPNSTNPWNSPWRIIAVGSLGDIVESTLGTDLAEPQIDMNMDFVKPGLASWSWAKLKDQSITYQVQKEFIDYASEMKWPYCLIDVNWDTTIGYDSIAQLAEYGKNKGVGLLLWYNSAGDWNTVQYHPKDKLLTDESRRNEFSRLNELGIKGIKVDFFAGDGQSMIAYYHDILKDAAEHRLLVNFHGATLPRGWHRTYPNLMTVEAVKGFEFITFFQEVADNAPVHSTILPFTRNVYDPMDFTPMSLTAIPGIERRTTRGFELALPTLYYSGIQHIAETPQGIAEVSDFVKEYLKALPASWDETRYLFGYPGKDVVLARRSGDVWYIAGINGENQKKTIEINLDFVKENEFIIIKDDLDTKNLVVEPVDINDRTSFKVTLLPFGGFIMKTGSL